MFNKIYFAEYLLSPGMWVLDSYYDYIMGAQSRRHVLSQRYKVRIGRRDYLPEGGLLDTIIDEGLS